MNLRNLVSGRSHFSHTVGTRRHRPFVRARDLEILILRNQLEFFNASNKYPLSQAVPKSGAKTERPGLQRALDFLRIGDSLVVWQLDRLGRSLKHLLETVAHLEERGIGFRSLQEALIRRPVAAV
jgi:hypothetical protein